MPTKTHQGESVKCLREMQGMKQEALAEKMGEDWTQKKISLLEAKETIEPEILEQVSRALNVPVDVVKNFNKDLAINIISNTFNSHDNSVQSGINYYPTFNPLDKLMEVIEENKKLYERLLQTEKERVELLERMLKKP